MLLTIGMIVKNEEKWLDRCLSAIKPILDNVDSELIITDTGSTDKTVEIAKKYTDKVLFFEWCNDFAAARNFGLKKAQGAWFMYLDADDIFEACDDIIHFFNSGEYKKYNSASYIGKNIVDNDGFYSINKQPRLTKIFPNTVFKNEIHEVFTTYDAPNKSLKDVAVHYGYLYENKASADAKHDRNKSLLLKRLEKEKDTSAFIYVQLCENEDNNLENDALKYIEEGIKVAKKLNDISIIPLYLHKVRLYIVNFMYSEALEICNEYFNLDKSFRPSILTADIEILPVKAYCLYKHDNYAEAVDTYTSFFKLRDKYVAGKLNTKDSEIISIESASDKNFIFHFSVFLKCLIKVEQYQEAYRRIVDTPLYKYINDKTSLNSLIENEIDIFSHLDFKNADKYVKNLDKRGKTLFFIKLCRLFYHTDERNLIINALKLLNTENDSFIGITEIYEKYLEDSVPADLLLNYCTLYGLTDHSDIIMIAMKENYDISPLIGKDKDNIKKIVWDGYRHYYGFHQAAEKYDVSCFSNSESLPFAAKFYEYCMQCTDDYKSPKPNVFITINANRLLYNFGIIGQRLKADNSEPTENYLKAAVIMGDVICLRERKAFKECISTLKSIINIYEPLAKYISDYCNEVIAEYNDLINTQQNNVSEMDRLSLIIKQNIKAYITSENYAAAQKTLNEYKQINPSDPEITTLFDAINQR